MSRIVSFDSEGNDITCMKVFDALENPCGACDNKDCPDRETKVPFDMVKYQEEKLMYDIDRFMDLYKKYKDEVDEILEFAELCKRFYPIKKRKYEE